LGVARARADSRPFLLSFLHPSPPPSYSPFFPVFAWRLSSSRAAELLELEATHNKKTAEAARAKLEALERQLGISSSSSSSRAPPPTIGDADELSSEAGPSGSSSTAAGGSGQIEGSRTKLTQQDLVELAGKRHKFEDNAFFEESREIKDNVRSAVSAGTSLLSFFFVDFQAGGRKRVCVVKLS
jgi:hypothetical protein